MSGTLYIVATPIGNLGDFTYRAVETLKNVAAVYCEDTRRTSTLLKAYQISKPLVRYDEHTHHRVVEPLMNRLKLGEDLALVTDAGTPVISDPGERLLERAHQEHISVVPIPGASAVLAALSATGWTKNGFVFLGFLPRRKGRAKAVLQDAIGLGKTVVLYESPFRVESTLKLMDEAQLDVEVCLGRELTKIHEEFIRGTLKDVISKITGKAQKGEFVVLVRPRETKSLTSDTSNGNPE